MDSAEFELIFDATCDAIDIYSGPETYLQTFRRADPDAGLLYAATFCQSEVCNGGFQQFFSNSTGVLAPEAVEGLMRLGMPLTAEVVQTACERLASPYPRGRVERKALLDALGQHTLRDLDEKFYGLLKQESGGFDSAMEQFVRRLVPRSNPSAEALPEASQHPSGTARIVS